MKEGHEKEGYSSLSQRNSDKARLNRTLTGEQNDLMFFQSDPSNQAEGLEDGSLDRSRQQMENKKHIRLAAYFGQTLRRLCLMEVGLLAIIGLQFLLVVVFGLAVFPSTKEFLGFLKGDFLYKDYLGLVTGNCCCFGLLTFGLGYFLNRREFTNQRVLYREVLRNELASKRERVQNKFLRPHVVYFSDLEQRVKKAEFEEQLQEYVDYAREGDSLSSEESFILDEEDPGRRPDTQGGFGPGFKRGKDLIGRTDSPDFEESVDRIFINSLKPDSDSVRQSRGKFGLPDLPKGITP